MSPTDQRPLGTAQATAPGKLILSGEHAVVFGRPALVTAIELHATARLTRADVEGVRITLPDLDAACEHPWSEVRARAVELRRRYREFLEGDRGIQAVLDEPTDLALYAVDLLTRELAGEDRGGLGAELRSEVPVGCGMGSSAATTAALLAALAAALGLEEPDLFAAALEVERLQHGRPSGVDPYVSLHGGCIRFRKGRAESRVAAAGRSIHLALTGRPASSTGECVMQVADRFEGDAIWDDFERVTLDFEKAWVTEAEADVRRLVRENHALLALLGVVPPRVREFVHELEKEGAAAKVCGAGAVRGEAAGAVFVAADAPPVALCKRFGYNLMEVHGTDEGAQVSVS